VAKEAGIGLGTASRALDPDSRYVADDVRAAVLQVAGQLGYRPNASARATTTGSTPTIAMLVSDIRDPYNAELVHGAISKARASGLLVTITSTDHVAEDQVRVIRMLRSQRPRALVLTGTHSGSSSSHRELLRELDRYQRDGGRIVVAGEDELPFDTAVVPRRDGARALITTLAGMGYRSVALVRPVADSARTRAWQSGIEEGARAAGVRLHRVISVSEVQTPRDGGYDAAADLMATQRCEIDALVAATDTIALGAMTAVRAAGLAPGVDIGVAGFDDVVDADDVTPGLTSVNLSLEAIGDAVVELAMRAPVEDRRIVEFEAKVCVRGSTPPRR
jgi:LacI family transcriptional regulator